jgi:hypothetical protein
MPKNLTRRFISLCLAGLLAGTLPVACAIEAPKPLETVQARLFTYERFVAEATSILERERSQLGAGASVLAVYDEEYTYRIYVARTGKPSLGVQPERLASETYQEILEAHKAGETWFINDIQSLPPGAPKEAFIAAGVTAAAAAPVFDNEGYLIGYVGATWRGGDVSEYIVSPVIEAAAAEISRLVRIF